MSFAATKAKRRRSNASTLEYNRRWYYLGRLDLIRQLGGKCVDCGTKGTEKNKLELDHIHGRDWEPRKKSRWMRLVIYRREAKEGLLAVRCARCNKKKGFSGRGKPRVDAKGPGERQEACHGEIRKDVQRGDFLEQAVDEGGRSDVGAQPELHPRASTG